MIMEYWKNNRVYAKRGKPVFIDTLLSIDAIAVGIWKRPASTPEEAKSSGIISVVMIAHEYDLNSITWDSFFPGVTHVSKSNCRDIDFAALAYGMSHSAYKFRVEARSLVDVRGGWRAVWNSGVATA